MLCFDFEIGSFTERAFATLVVLTLAPEFAVFNRSDILDRHDSRQFGLSGQFARGVLTRRCGDRSGIMAQTPQGPRHDPEWLFTTYSFKECRS